MIRWGCGDQGPVKPGVTHDDRPVEDPEERSSRRCEPSVRELLGRQGWARRWRASRLGWRLSSVTSVRIRRNSGETIANYAASRISQLRKSSSAASQPSLTFHVSFGQAGSRPSSEHTNERRLSRRSSEGAEADLLGVSAYACPAHASHELRPGRLLSLTSELTRTRRLSRRC